jgi:hypothetical protein
MPRKSTPTRSPHSREQSVKPTSVPRPTRKPEEKEDTDIRPRELIEEFPKPEEEKEETFHESRESDPRENLKTFAGAAKWFSEFLLKTNKAEEQTTQSNNEATQMEEAPINTANESQKETDTEMEIQKPSKERTTRSVSVDKRVREETTESSEKPSTQRRTDDSWQSARAPADQIKINALQEENNGLRNKVTKLTCDVDRSARDVEDSKTQTRDLKETLHQFQTRSMEVEKNFSAAVAQLQIRQNDAVEFEKQHLKLKITLLQSQKENDRNETKMKNLREHDPNATSEKKRTNRENKKKRKLEQEMTIQRSQSALDAKKSNEMRTEQDSKTKEKEKKKTEKS